MRERRLCPSVNATYLRLQLSRMAPWLLDSVHDAAQGPFPAALHNTSAESVFAVAGGVGIGLAGKPLWTSFMPKAPVNGVDPFAANEAKSLTQDSCSSCACENKSHMVGEQPNHVRLVCPNVPHHALPVRPLKKFSASRKFACGIRDERVPLAPALRDDCKPRHAPLQVDHSARRWDYVRFASMFFGSLMIGGGCALAARLPSEEGSRTTV